MNEFNYPEESELAMDDDYDDDTYEYSMPNFLSECIDAFNIIDAVLASDDLSDEDEKTVMQMDLDIAESNQVTEEQFKTLDSLREKYKVVKNEA